jgi:hypothetical protein
MSGQIPNQLDLLLAERGDRQFGVVSRDELLRAVPADDIDWALKKLRLRPLFRGVYAVGHTAIRREGWWFAALKACGRGSTLGGRSAGQYWRLAAGHVFPIAVYSAADRGRTQPRIKVRQAVLDPSERFRVDGLSITTPARTLIDLHATLTPRDRRELIERAQDLKRFDSRALRRCLDLHLRQPGRRPLLDFLDMLEPRDDGTRSHLERLFLPLSRGAGLERPLVNRLVEGRQRDFVWPDRRLVVEVDGHAFHSSRAAIRRDKARDRELVAARWLAVRFTYEDVAFEPQTVESELAKIARVAADGS